MFRSPEKVSIFDLLTKYLDSLFQVRKISFTGSTAVGKYLMGGAATTVKKVRIDQFSFMDNNALFELLLSLQIVWYTTELV